MYSKLGCLLQDMIVLICFDIVCMGPCKVPMALNLSVD